MHSRWDSIGQMLDTHQKAIYAVTITKECSVASKHVEKYTAEVNGDPMW
jgi:hypothetical protein